VTEGVGLGTGRETWPCSKVFFQYLRRTIVDFKNHAFVELGAGTGYLSLNLAAEGASMVVATDYCRRILKNLRCSVHKNKVQKRMRVVRWDWNDSIPNEIKKLKLGEKVTLHLLASDTIYGASCCDLLPQCIRDFTDIYPKTRVTFMFKIRDDGQQKKSFYENLEKVSNYLINPCTKLVLMTDSVMFTN